MKDKIHVEHYIGFSKSNDEIWKLTDNYCPKCGEKKVYAETIYFEYHDERTHICLACDTSFWLARLEQSEKLGNTLRNIAEKIEEEGD